MRRYPTKEFSLTISLLLLLANTMIAGMAPSNIASYWADAELIAIGTVGPVLGEVQGRKARYHLTITELIRGPELESLEDIEVISPYHLTSNDRWHTGSPGTPSIFFGTWSEEEQAWIVPRAAQLKDHIMEDLEILRYVNAAKDQNEREARIEESLEKNDPSTIVYLLSEAKRLNREDLILAHYQRAFRLNPLYLNAADRLLYLGDRSPLPKLKAYLADPELKIKYERRPRYSIARMLSIRLGKEATPILEPYLNDENDYLSLEVARHLIRVEDDSDKWKFIFQLAQTTSEAKVRYNACYKLSMVADHIPIEGLRAVREFAGEHGVSVAIMNDFNHAIVRREKKLSKAASAETKD